MTFSLANAPELIEAAHAAGLLKSGNWGDGTHAVCMMSALVPGANSIDNCVTAGWPKWLAELNVSLFDASVGAADEAAARYQFARDVATAVSVPRNYDKAHDGFLIRRLDTGDYSALKTLRSLTGDFSRQIAAIDAVVALLRRRMAGENVEAEMSAARAVARAAADAVADAAARAAAYAAARAAAYAVADAAYAVADAAARAVADAAARAVAYAAARAAARADLIAALNTGE